VLSKLFITFVVYKGAEILLAGHTQQSSELSKLFMPAAAACSEETHLHWFHASSMDLDTEYELIGILIGAQLAAVQAGVRSCRGTDWCVILHGRLWVLCRLVWFCMGAGWCVSFASGVVLRLYVFTASWSMCQQQLLLFSISIIASLGTSAVL
jgi:hypothetical protein